MRCNAADDAQRRKILLEDGVTERGNETAEAAMMRVREHLNLPAAPLEMARRVGPKREDRPRPILATFTRVTDRNAALRNARIHTNDDLCPASQP